MVKDVASANVVLTVEPDTIHVLFPLLQYGVLVDVPVGCSIRTMLCEHLRLSPEYVESRITTIFLDGKPVDDIDSAIIKDGSTLALSAAMPGLAGATLRRGGPLASLRSQITYLTDTQPSSPREGMIVLKLFNLLTRELGPAILRRGVYVKREDLERFVLRLPEEFWRGCTAATLNGHRIELDRLLRTEWRRAYQLVMLRVESEKKGHC